MVQWSSRWSWRSAKRRGNVSRTVTTHDGDVTSAVRVPGAMDVARPPARSARLIVWFVLALAVVAAFASIHSDSSSLVVLVMAALNGAVGTVLALRRPRNPIGWIFLAVLLVFTIQPAADALGGSAVQRGAALPSGLPLALIWVETWAFQLLFGLYYGLTLVFPSGRLPGGRIGRVVRVSLLVPVAGVIVSAFGPHLAGIYAADTNTLGRSLDNPFALLPFPDGLDHLFQIVTVGLLIAGIVSIIIRLGRARGIEREQMKWFVAALSLTGALVFGVTAVVVTVPQHGLDIWLLAVLGYAAIPPAVGVAVLRYRLFEIDRIISRTMGYAIVTVILGAIFAGAVLGLQALLRPITAESQAAVAVSTLLVVALFGPIRHGVQGIVDRRFDRSRYDAARVVDGFGARLRDRLELHAVSVELAATAHAALRPASVSVWVRRRPKGRGDM